MALGFVSKVAASGFYIPVQDPYAAARGNGFVATANRPSAIYYNPAGLTQLDSLSVHSGVYAIRLGLEAATSLDGRSHDNNAEFIPLPHLYVAIPVADRVVAGVGVNTPFGLGTDWGKGTPFGGVATETRVAFVASWGVLAYELSDSLSVGGGIGVSYAKGELSRIAAPLVDPVSEFKFEGDDLGVNWIASLLWRPHPQHSFGITYRGKTELDLEGDAGAPGVGLPKGDAALDLVTPDTLAFGYAFKPNDQWAIEANLEWVNWEHLNTSTLKQEFSGNTPIPFNWDSNLVYGIGVTYAPNDTWSFGAGYALIENSQPDLNFSPAVADADRHWLSAGVTYQHEDWTVDLAYQYAFSNRSVKDRTAAIDANDLVAGDYESKFHGLMLSVIKRF